MNTWRLFGVDPYDGDEHFIGTMQLAEHNNDSDVFRTINATVKVHSLSGSTLIGHSKYRLVRTSTHMAITDRTEAPHTYYRMYCP